jgi:hypothetical protein
MSDRITFKVGDALEAEKFEELGGVWNPDTHWIITPGEPIEAAYVQKVLDSFAEHIEAYAYAETFPGSYCLELQFSDKAIAKACNQEYVKGWRKGGAVAKAKQAKREKAKKRLPKNRMYRLPDKTEFLYFGLWDGHGNLWGNTIDYETNRLTNKIVHRSMLEESELIPNGEEPWGMD